MSDMVAAAGVNGEGEGEGEWRWSGVKNVKERRENDGVWEAKAESEQNER